MLVNSLINIIVIWILRIQIETNFKNKESNRRLPDHNHNGLSNTFHHHI